MQVMAAADPIQLAKGVGLERRLARARAEVPAHLDTPDYDGYPESADGEPDYGLPINGATTVADEQRQDTGPTGIQPFQTFDASQWEGASIEERRWIAENRIPVGEP